MDDSWKEFATLGMHIRSFRKERELTQAQLSEKVQMDQNSISRIERGVAIPSLESLLKICGVLAVTPNDVLLECYDAPAPVLDAEIAKLLDGLSAEEHRKVMEYIRFVKSS